MNVTEKGVPLNFRNENASRILEDWWTALENEKGERAILRRCKDLDEIAFSPAYHRLRKKLSSHGFFVKNEDLALVAGVLSHIRTNQTRGNLPALMAERKKGSDSPRVSEMRFRKLLSIQDKKDLYLTIIRLIKMTDNSAPIIGVASDLYWWNERTKKAWALAYYEKIV